MIAACHHEQHSTRRVFRVECGGKHPPRLPSALVTPPDPKDPLQWQDAPEPLANAHSNWYGGFKDDSVDWYELQVPDGSDWIEYMLNIPRTADHQELGVQNHFSFGVKDVHVAARQLRFNGLHKFDGPEIGRDGKDSLDIYDPDGTRVEIMEFAPTQKPYCHPYTASHPKP